MAGVKHGDLVVEPTTVECILSFLGSGQFWEGNYTGLRISQNHSHGVFYLDGTAPVPVYFLAVFAITASGTEFAELAADGSFVSVLINGQWMSYSRITNSQCTDGQYQICSNSPNGRFYRPCVFGSYVSQCSLVSCFPGFCEVEVDNVTTCGAC